MARISKKLQAFLDEFQERQENKVCVYGVGKGNCDKPASMDSEVGLCAEHSTGFHSV